MIYERIVQTIHRIVCTAKLVGMLVALGWCLLVGSILMAHCGCTDPNIHLPRDQCFEYTLRDGRTVVVWISEVPQAGQGLPVVESHGLPWPVDPEEFE